MKKSINLKKNAENKLWAEGYFVETISDEDWKKRMKTFHKKHNEDMSFNCQKCNKIISAHNKDWHNGMCDDCFDKAFFPDAKRRSTQIG